MRSTWTSEADERLATLWETGMPAREIGSEMGLTKGAVIGRVHRLKLKGRGRGNNQYNTGRPRKTHRANPNPIVRLRRFKERQRTEATVMTIAPLNIPFMDLDEERHCREVVGQGEDGLALYCGHQRREGSSYCPFHSSVNEHLAPPRVRRAA